MSLEVYHKKRNFSKSPEPKGSKVKKASSLSFVVQRHQSSHLHYDFRLEVNDVLKSWAVPKGPSMNPQDKRLAMMVEDHPYDYKDFEGVIPDGNYGAGIVEIWDSGTYTPIDERGNEMTESYIEEAIKKGDVKFSLLGNKLKGVFALVKLHQDEDMAWLLIKHRDEFSIDQSYNSEDKTAKDSPINMWISKNKKSQKKKKHMNASVSKT